MTEIRIAAPTDNIVWNQVVNRTRSGIVPAGYTYDTWFGGNVSRMNIDWSPTGVGIWRDSDLFGFTTLPLSTLYQPADADRATIITVDMTATAANTFDYLVARYRLGGAVQVLSDNPVWTTDGSVKSLTQVFVIPAGAVDITISSEDSAVTVSSGCITALSVTAEPQYMPAPNATTFKIWRPASGLTDVTSKMLGSFILTGAQAGSLEIELTYTYDLTTWVGNPARAGKLLVINPTRFTRVHAKPSSSFGFPGATFYVWHRWNGGSTITDVDLAIPGSTTATGSYNSKLKLPPLLIDVPAGQSMSELTIAVALNGGVAGTQQPTLFVPC